MWCADARTNIDILTCKINCYGMSSKEIVRDLLDKLPDEASLTEIAGEIEFLAGVREGISDLDHGRTVTTEQLRERLRSWTTSK